jgi:hypothetical protein
MRRRARDAPVLCTPGPRCRLQAASAGEPLLVRLRLSCVELSTHSVHSACGRRLRRVTFMLSDSPERECSPSQRQAPEEGREGDAASHSQQHSELRGEGLWECTTCCVEVRGAGVEQTCFAGSATACCGEGGAAGATAAGVALEQGACVALAGMSPSAFARLTARERQELVGSLQGVDCLACVSWQPGAQAGKPLVASPMLLRRLC